MPMIRLPTGLSLRSTGKACHRADAVHVLGQRTTAPAMPGRRNASMTNRVSHTRTLRVVGWSFCQQFDTIDACVKR
jgi:hypothetical protein